MGELYIDISLQIAYEEGLKAARNYRSLATNPYFPIDERHDEWVKGWLAERDRQQEEEENMR